METRLIEPKAPHALCHQCPLQRRDCVPTTGPADAEYAFVSRSPGRWDAEAGKPFGGMSGLVLDAMLEEHGHSRESVLTTNIVLCETDDPPKDAIEACKPRLMAEIDNAHTIIAGGAEAARLLANTSVNSGRGFVHDRVNTRMALQRVVVTNNPAAILRDSDNFPNFVEDFKLAFDPPPPLAFPEVKVCNDRQSARRAIKRLSDYSFLAADLEGHRPHIECAGFAYDTDVSYVLTRKALDSVWEEFSALCKNADIHFLWHNGIYDVKLLKDNGIAGSIGHDTFAMSYVLDERPGTHSLDYLCRLWLGWGNYTPAVVQHYKETGELPTYLNDLHEYNGLDVGGTLQLYNQLKPKVEEENLYRLYEVQYIPFFNALTDIERRGFHYDVIRAADLNEEVVLPMLKQLRGDLAGIAELELYNPMSHPQTKAVVYDKWKLRHRLRDTHKKKRQTGFDKDVRKEVREGRFDSAPRARDKLIEFATVYDRFRSIETQRGTFIEGLIRRVASDGKLYCEFNPCGTVTGRTSSREPNFQNITREARDVVPGIRTLFLPSPGNVIVQADFSQAELRCIAKFSGDKNLLAIYRDSARSLHKETAAKFYGEKYTKEEYVISKNINFGVCYDQGAYAFSQMYGITVKEAQDYIDNWFRMFPDVVSWKEEIYERVDTEQVLVSPWGSKRRFHLITLENVNELHRQGVNFLPQNTAGLLTIAAINDLHVHELPIISTVHDSIIADVPEDEAVEIGALMKEVMERQALKIDWDDIPFKVDISVGPTWGEVEELELAA